MSCGFVWDVVRGSFVLGQAAPMDVACSGTSHECLIRVGSRVFEGLGLFVVFLKLFLSSFVLRGGALFCWRRLLWSGSPAVMGRGFSACSNVLVEDPRSQMFPSRPLHCDEVINIGGFNWFLFFQCFSSVNMLVCCIENSVCVYVVGVTADMNNLYVCICWL